MELPSIILKQNAFITRAKMEEHMLIVMDKRTHKQHLSQPLETNNNQFKLAVTFLTGYNGIFKVTNSNNKFYSKQTYTNEDHFIQITLQPGAKKIESLNNEIRRFIIDEEQFTETDYPLQIKPNFSTRGSIIEISPHGLIIQFCV